MPIDSRDAVGHGTVTAGIAAGNGRAFGDGKYAGLAPEADLIIVKLTSEGAPAHGNQPEEVPFQGCIETALDWLEAKMAESGQPTVALINSGVQWGPIDGTSAVSQKIDQVFGLDRPGRVYVAPSGDEGRVPNHAGGDFSSSGESIIQFTKQSSAQSTFLSMWYAGAFRAEVTVEFEDDTRVGPVGPGESKEESEITIIQYEPSEEFYPWQSTSGDRAVWIRINGHDGAGSVRIRALETGTGRFDLYGDLSGGNLTSTVTFNDHVVSGRLTDYASSRAAIVVGAHVARHEYRDADGISRNLSSEGRAGELYFQSSGGPTRDGRSPGVDLTAPGHNAFAALAQNSYWTTLRGNLVDDGGGWYVRGGATSGAAPVVVGAIALMLQMKPDMTARQVRQILRDTALSDEKTGSTPNLDWGFGKLNVASALAATQRLFSVSDRGGIIRSSQGDGLATTVGYAGIEADSGMTTPSGLAIFGFRQNGVLVAEAGVPAVATVQEGRIFAEVNGPVNTGLAIANPNDTAATITFFFTDTSGVDFGSGSFELGANKQTSKFLDQDPFNGGTSLLGTFTFTSSMPIAVIALRGFTNERSEFLMTTLPVTPLSSTASNTVYFPHFVDGSGWTTQVVLVNPTETMMMGTVQFLGQGSGTTAASPVPLTLDDASSGSSFAYSIPARTSQRFTTSNPAGTVSVGSVRATPDGGSTTPSGLLVFSFVSGGVTVSEAGVPALPEGSAFRVYVEASGTPEQIGSVRSGVAITDTSGASNTVTLELTNLDGSLASAATTVPIPPSGQVARFLDELFSVLDNFSGVLRITSTADIAIVGLRLRINSVSDIKMTTTPPSNELSATTTADTYFPHIVDSGGWSTQFILFSGTAGQTSSGSLSFIDQSGQALDLSVN